MTILWKGKKVAKEDTVMAQWDTVMAYIIRQVEESVGHSDDAVYSDGKTGPMIAQQAIVTVELETMMTE